jgi:hypothetical protein
MEWPVIQVKSMKLSKKFIDLEPLESVNQEAELCPGSPIQAGVW